MKNRIMLKNVLSSALLPLLLLLALALRLPGINWGLPFVYHPDEPTHVGIVVNILKTGDFNPHWFKYPSFRIYASVPIAIAYFLMGVSQGHFKSVQELVPAQMLTVGSGTTAIPGLYLGLRLWMAVFGLIGIVYLYEQGRRSYGLRVGCLAALFLAVSPLHVLVSHWYRPDTILALFSGAAVLAATLLYRRNELRMYIVCGVLIGLAASVKYNAAVLQLVPVFLAHVLAKRNLFDWRLWLIFPIAGVVFLLITPYALLDLPAFLDGFAFEIDHYYVRGHPGADWTSGPLGNFLWYLGTLLSYDGLLVLLAACAPWLVEHEHRREVLVLVSWPLLVLVLSSTAKVHTALALIPLLLILYVLAALALDRLLHRGAERWPWLGSRYALPLLLVVLVALPLARAVRTDSFFVRPDVRTVAKEWIERELPADTRLALEGYAPVLNWPGALYMGPLSNHSLEWYQAAGIEYLVASNYSGYLDSPELYPEQAAGYQRLFQLPRVATIEGPLQYHVEPMSQILIFQVPLPERYTLAMAEANAPWLKSGFYPPEQGEGQTRRWTEGEARVQVRLKPETTYLVRVRGQAKRPADVPPARTQVLLNGQSIAEHQWTEQGEEWSFPLRVENQTRPGGVFAELVFSTNPWRPQDAGQSGDDRTLGVLLEQIVIEEAPASQAVSPAWP